MEFDDVILAHTRRMRLLPANCRQWKKCNHKCSDPPLGAHTSQPLALQTAMWLCCAAKCDKTAWTSARKKKVQQTPLRKTNSGPGWTAFCSSCESGVIQWRMMNVPNWTEQTAIKRSESKMHLKFNGDWYISRLHPHDCWIRVITMVWLYKKYLKGIVMYSYCYVCSVLYILFPSCQLAFSDYPDWGFSVLFPQL